MKFILSLFIFLTTLNLYANCFVLYSSEEDHNNALHYFYKYHKQKYPKSCSFYTNITSLHNDVLSFMDNNKKGSIHLIYQGHGYFDTSKDGFPTWKSTCHKDDVVTQEDFQELSKIGLKNGFKVGVTIQSYYSGNSLLNRDSWKNKNQNKYPCVLTSSSPGSSSYSSNAKGNLLLRETNTFPSGKTYWKYYLDTTGSTELHNNWGWETLYNSFWNISTGTYSKKYTSAFSSAFPVQQTSLNTVFQKIATGEEVNYDDTYNLINHLQKNQLSNCSNQDYDSLSCGDFYEFDFATQPIIALFDTSKGYLESFGTDWLEDRALEAKLNTKIFAPSTQKQLKKCFSNKVKYLYQYVDNPELCPKYALAELCSTSDEAKMIFNLNYGREEAQKRAICKVDKHFFQLVKKVSSDFNKLTVPKTKKSIENYLKENMKNYSLYNEEKLLKILDLKGDKSREKHGLFDIIYEDFVRNQAHKTFINQEDRAWQKACQDISYPY